MLNATRGAVRKDAVEIELTGEWPEGLVVGVKAIGTDQSLSWDFERRTPDLVTKDGTAAPSRWTLRLDTRVLPQPTYSIELVQRTDGAVSPIATDAETWHLGFLAPRTDKEFVARYTWEGQRIRDGETLLFSLVQILSHRWLSNPNFASAAVIYGYRILEADDATRVAQAMAFVQTALPLAPQFDATRHVRTDRDHMIISLNTVAWHLAAYVGRRADVMQALANIHDALQNVEDAWSVGYNGSKGLLLYSVLLAGEGDVERSREVNHFLFRLFQRAAASSQNTNPTLFNDFRMVHRATFLGIVMNRTFDGLSTPNDMRVTMELIAPDVLRVRSKRMQAKLTAELSAFEQVAREADVTSPST